MNALVLGRRRKKKRGGARNELGPITLHSATSGVTVEISRVPDGKYHHKLTWERFECALEFNLLVTLTSGTAHEFQFAMDARSAPQKILAGYLADELALLERQARSSAAPPLALPSPVSTESSAVPLDHGVGPDHQE